MVTAARASRLVTNRVAESGPRRDSGEEPESVQADVAGDDHEIARGNILAETPPDR
jgi:hypothetical protein